MFFVAAVKRSTQMPPAQQVPARFVRRDFTVDSADISIDRLDDVTHIPVLGVDGIALKDDVLVMSLGAFLALRSIVFATVYQYSEGCAVRNWYLRRRPSTSLP